MPTQSNEANRHQCLSTGTQRAFAPLQNLRNKGAEVRTVSTPVNCGELAPFSIVVVGLIVASAVYWLAQPKWQVPELPEFRQHSAIHQSGGDRRVVVEGFNTANYNADGKVASRLRLGKCELRPQSAAFWLFDSGPILEMHDVQVDLFRWRSTDPSKGNRAAWESAAAIEPLARLPRQLRWGAIGGLDVRNAAFNLYEDGQRETTIHAEQMTPGLSGELTFKKAVSIHTRNDRRQLTGDEVIWWPQIGILAVKGQYQLTEAGNPRSSARTIFNLSLEPITNQQEISTYEQRIQHKVALVAAQ